MKTELKKKFTGILQRTISLRTPFDQIAEISAEAALENLDGLHDQIMNLPCLDQPGVERNSQIAYKTGHRDARHAAAELVAMIEAETKNESPIGTVIMAYAPPPGFLLCNGAEIDRNIYSQLFAVLGTKAGKGNGSTTFNLPKMPGYIRAWNPKDTRFYPPEVQAAIERDTPKKPKRGDPFLCEGDEFICPSCDGHVRRSLLKGNCCCHCGQRLDWKERNTPQKLVKDIRSHHRCPTCESDLVKLIDEPTSCCPVCSQRLDWSE